MSLESTNNWVVKNYKSLPWYSQPIAVMAVQVDSPLEGYMIMFDLYKGSSFRTSVSYIEQAEVFESEDQSEHQRLMIENSNYAKAEWLEKEAEALNV